MPPDERVPPGQEGPPAGKVPPADKALPPDPPPGDEPPVQEHEGSKGEMVEPPVVLNGDDRRQIEEIRNLLLVRRSSELVDLVTFLKSRRSLAWSNFVMGLSRGIGFFLGFTLVGAVIVALLGFFVDWTAETFSSSYSTRSIVRSVMGKYEEVMDEVAVVQGERSAEADAALPSATGAHLGAVFARRSRD